MRLSSHHLYHIYNQGNNREQLFYSRANYLLFLQKVREYIHPHCKIMAWCLMPNHFHFLIGTTSTSTEKIKMGSLDMHRLSKGFATLESSYARAINHQEKRTGSLFRQKTKAKCLTEEAFFFEDRSQKYAPDFYNPYPLTCFRYIHQNPVKAKLVNKMSDWEFSSIQDYLGIREGKLCDFSLCQRWVGVEAIDLDANKPVPLKAEDVSGLFVDFKRTDAQ